MRQAPSRLTVTSDGGSMLLITARFPLRVEPATLLHPNMPAPRDPLDCASRSARDPYSAFRVRSYSLYAGGNFIAVLGRQMLGVVVAYEIHARTQSAFALGLIGLAGALPIIFLALPAGHVADRANRRSLIVTTQLLSLLTSVGLALLSWQADRVPPEAALRWLSGGLQWLSTHLGERGTAFGPEIPLYFALLLVNGVARTFGWAARAPFIANLVGRDVLANAITWNSSLFEIGCVAGPALGGFLLAKFGFPLVYLLDAMGSLCFIAFLLPIPALPKGLPREDHPLDNLLTGVRFVLNTKVILATITLDLFAVLLGGATALLPIYADKILHVGSFGMGWLRGAQSLGAIVMAVGLAHLPPMRKAGSALLWAVAGFGLATIVFGLSRTFWLSMAALAVAGACDNVSVVVRHTLVQLLTPDSMRGRVAAVNNIFIGSSNELGAFESGLTAALIGPIASVVTGGLGTLLVVVGVAAKWPEVRRIGSLHAMPEENADSAENLPG